MEQNRESNKDYQQHELVAKKSLQKFNSASASVR